MDRYRERKRTLINMETKSGRDMKTDRHREKDGKNRDRNVKIKEKDMVKYAGERWERHEETKREGWIK